jgi:hypothetical protein
MEVVTLKALNLGYAGFLQVLFYGSSAIEKPTLVFITKSSIVNPSVQLRFK